MYIGDLQDYIRIVWNKSWEDGVTAKLQISEIVSAQFDDISVGMGG